MKQETGVPFLTLGEAMTMLVAKEPGALSEVSEFTRHLAGAELNVAIGMARLGFHSVYLSKVGHDCFGRYIKRQLAEEGVITNWIGQSTSHSTGMVFKSNQTDGSDPLVEYFRRNSAASTLSQEDLAPELINKMNHLHLTGVACAVSPSLLSLSRHALKAAREHGITTSFDTNLRPSLWPDQDTMRDTINELAAGCDTVLPGVEEGLVLTGSDDPEQVADFYLQRGVNLVIVKLGSDGAYYKTSQGQSGFVAGFRVDKVVDTVGAGDSFAVGVISALLDGRGIEQAVARGNWFGSLAVQVRGDSEGLPSRAQLDEFERGELA